MTSSNGLCKPGYEAVREAFEANFEDGGELGASVAMTVDGEQVVDLWAGDADESGRPWVEDTIVNVYSSTKTMAALCVLMLSDRGLIDLDAPVADYWPEFARNGKDGVLVRHVMSHSAGLPGFDPPLAIADLYDWETVRANLEAAAPWWEPGTQVGYHAVTQGYLQGELVRRVDGRSLGTFFREEVAGPLDADFHIGLPESEDAASRSSCCRRTRSVPNLPAPNREASWRACTGERRRSTRRKHGHALGGAPRSLPRTEPGTRARSRASTRCSRATAPSTACTCCRSRR